MIRVEALTGDALLAALEDVAALRIAVFRDFPYLYDGDMENERSYIASYRDSPRAVIAAAYEGDRIIGVSTGTPLADHASDFAAPFASTGIALERVFYCAESVLLPQWRGRGLGHRFFDLREAHARAHGFEYSAFCSVIRPTDHPARPSVYRPLDPFWTARGYQPLEGVKAQFDWRDIGESQPSRKELQFWMRAL